MLPAILIVRLAGQFVDFEDVQPAQLRLSVIERLVVVVLCIGVLIAHLANDVLSIASLLLGILVLAACWVVLWFRRVEGGTTLLDNYLPMQPLSFLWIGIALGDFYPCGSIRLSIAACAYLRLQPIFGC